MKSILLTTTALVAFAGAAVADGHTSIAFTGNTELGYNDSDPSDTALANPDFNNDEQGFYWNTDIDVSMSATLDNGLTATTSFEIDIVGDDDNSATLNSDEWVASLESDTAGIFLGDTSFAAETRWVSAGDMESDGFSEADGETAIRGDIAAGGVEASISYTIADANQDYVSATNGDDVDQLSFGVAGQFGMFSMAAAYQEESEDAFGAVANAANGDYNPNEIYGISAGVSVAGADITVAYASDETDDTNSTGIKVAYPFGPVVGTVYYVSEDDDTDEDNYGVNLAYSSGAIAVEADYQDDQGVEKWALEGSYDVGNGLTVFAGVLNDNEGDEEDYYIATTYDLGGGAELLVAYAEDDDGDNEDEIGTNEYQDGTTIELSFAF